MGNSQKVYDLEKEIARLQAANDRLEKELAEQSSEAKIDMSDYGIVGYPYELFVQACTNKGIEVKQFDETLVLTGVIFGTTLEGWTYCVPQLLIEANFYKQQIRMCGWYAFKLQNECAERTDMNGMRMAVQKTNRNIPHAYCILPVMEKGKGITDILIVEPNLGYEWAGLLPFGAENYSPDYTLL